MNNKFANNLKKLRKEKNISQVDLAEELGVSRQAISKWESSVAYPEMDKIILICEKFNVNIDDLLHRDIKEIKSDEESKKRINIFVDSFLSYITDTVNMLHNMTFKSKMKCLFELLFLGLFLFFIGAAIWGFVGFIFNQLLCFVPSYIYMIMENVFDGIVVSLLILLGIIIMIHVFKTRYLDYYQNFKLDKKEENAVSEKIEYKDEEKIIIRDPKHSEYRFVNAVCKFFVFIFKILLSFVALGFMFALLGLSILMVLFFLISKSGAFFIGLLLSGIGATLMCFICLLGLLYFIFNHKSNKKAAILLFVCSILILGIGIGVTLSASTKFEFVKAIDEENINSLEIPMTDNLYIDQDVKYDVKDIDNVLITYSSLPGIKLLPSHYLDDGGIYLFDYTSDALETIRFVISHLNKKQFVSIDTNIEQVTVYANEENIQKLKTNYQQKFNKIENRDE